MKVVTAEEMRRLDELAQTQYGVSAFDLMAEAGKAIALEAEKTFRPEKICVVCGKGNNAGDGFMVAQEFHQMGRAVTVVCLEASSAYGGPAKTAWERLKQTKVPTVGPDQLETALSDTDLIIDALLGTGTTGAVREPYASIISHINSSGKTVVAADIPSGLRDLQPDEDPGAIIQANLTVTIGLPKLMLLVNPGTKYAGRVAVAPINFPATLLTGEQWMLNVASGSDLAEWLPKRTPDSNKGSYGHVGIVGGAVTYAGATLLTARAALRSGCGLATIYSLASTNAIYKTALPEATSHIIESGSEAHFDAVAGQNFKSAVKEHSVLAVGPGLGQSPGTGDFFRIVLSTWGGPLIIDADGLNLLSGDLLPMVKNRKDTLLTPHPGEMSRLTGISVKEIQSKRVSVVREFAVQHGLTLLLKGTGTLVARPDGQVYLIPGSEPALAKGGTGDVLTGAIAALIAQGVSIWQAAVLAATAHLHAGHNCAKRYGTRGVLASEVADEIPLVLDSIEQHHVHFAGIN